MRRITPNFLLPPSKGSHPTSSSKDTFMLSAIGFIIAESLISPSTPSHNGIQALRMLFAQILTYRTPTRCNAPSQWGMDFCGLKAQAKPTVTAFIDRSRQKPTEAQKTHRTFPMHFVCLSHPIHREVLVTNSIKKHCKIA